ncbi:MAG: hypothetical protein II207_00735, partial [Clostridia bacterium]|nr:hypothetical protein [Clostridia bacterium]
DGGRMEIEDNHVKIILSNGLGKLPSESECKKILSDIVLEEFGISIGIKRSDSTIQQPLVACSEVAGESFTVSDLAQVFGCFLQ